MLIERLVLGELQTNCWLASDGVGGPLVVIDPAGEPEEASVLLRAIAHRPVIAVVLTHAHFDHLGLARAVVEATEAPLLVHEDDAERLASAAPGGTGGALFGYDYTAPKADRLLHEGDVIVAGNLQLEVLSTPGHTLGSICLLSAAAIASPGANGAESEPRDCVEGVHLFSGDTLFAGSVGRTDFPAGDGRAMRASIARLAGLPDDTSVHPGHGPETSIGREQRVNPFFPRA